MVRRQRLWAAFCAAMLLALPMRAQADEADNFTCRQQALGESLGALDAVMNSRLAEAVERANRRGPSCDARCLIKELQSHVGGSYLSPYTFVPHAKFTRAVRRLEDLGRCHLPFGDTIYGARPYSQPWLWPFLHRIIFVADSIRLNGRIVGLDKIEHFVREGLEHWRRVHDGSNIRASLQHEIGSGRRGLTWTEWGVKGVSLTGVFAYADLAAGRAGYRFWTDALSVDEPGSYVSRDGTAGRFTVRRPFSFASYVDDTWDEAVNCSTFDSKIGPGVSAALGRLSMSCPVKDCRPLASLEDSDLIVSPVCRGEADTRRAQGTGQRAKGSQRSAG